MKRRAILLLIPLAAMVTTAGAGPSVLRLGPEQLVGAGGTEISVPGYSIPSFVDWNGDGLKDLVTGQGSGTYRAAKVRIYLNSGTPDQPVFTDYFYAQTKVNDTYQDLTCPGSGCLGCFPRVVYWDADARKDLIVGQADGKVKIFLNVGTDQEPVFDAGTFLQYGLPGEKVDFSTVYRATPTVVDWNNDGRRDLVAGARFGEIYLLLNYGTDTEQDFRFKMKLQANGAELDVPGDRSSPVVTDLDGDGKKDLLVGNTNGQLLFYTNTGIDEDPNFAGFEFVEADGLGIDLPGSPRSRPFVCDWTGDGYPDVLIGAGDGRIHLYQSIPQPGDMDGDYDVEADDFALFALYWGQTACGRCGGADLFDDGAVNMLDLLAFGAEWLEGLAP